MTGNLDGLTSGASTTLNIVENGKIVEWELITNFTYKEDSQIMKKIPMNAFPLHPKLFQGWSGSFSYFRSNSAIVDYIIAQQRNYYLGGDQIGLTINQTIREMNGLLTSYKFSNVVVLLDNGGSFSGTDIVEQSLSFMCSVMDKI
jgi:hypothetical protein